MWRWTQSNTPSLQGCRPTWVAVNCLLEQKDPDSVASLPEHALHAHSIVTNVVHGSEDDIREWVGGVLDIVYQWGPKHAAVCGYGRGIRHPVHTRTQDGCMGIVQHTLACTCMQACELQIMYVPFQVAALTVFCF